MIEPWGRKRQPLGLSYFRLFHFTTEELDFNGLNAIATNR